MMLTSHVTHTLSLSLSLFHIHTHTTHTHTQESWQEECSKTWYSPRMSHTHTHTHTQAHTICLSLFHTHTHTSITRGSPSVTEDTHTHTSSHHMSFSLTHTHLHINRTGFSLSDWGRSPCAWCVCVWVRERQTYCCVSHSHIYWACERERERHMAAQGTGRHMMCPWYIMYIVCLLILYGYCDTGLSYAHHIVCLYGYSDRAVTGLSYAQHSTSHDITSQHITWHHTHTHTHTHTSHHSTAQHSTAHRNDMRIIIIIIIIIILASPICGCGSIWLWNHNQTPPFHRKSLGVEEGWQRGGGSFGGKGVKALSGVSTCHEMNIVKHFDTQSLVFRASTHRHPFHTSASPIFISQIRPVSWSTAKEPCISSCERAVCYRGFSPERALCCRVFFWEEPCVGLVTPWPSFNSSASPSTIS